MGEIVILIIEIYIFDRFLLHSSIAFLFCMIIDPLLVLRHKLVKVAISVLCGPCNISAKHWLKAKGYSRTVCNSAHLDICDHPEKYQRQKE